MDFSRQLFKNGKQRSLMRVDHPRAFCEKLHLRFGLSVGNEKKDTTDKTRSNDIVLGSGIF